MYPTEKELNTIANWSYDDLSGLMQYVKEIWSYADDGYWSQNDNTYCLSTGGWSGNENIIQALNSNGMFWALCWFSSQRGGHFKFVLPRIL